MHGIFLPMSPRHFLPRRLSFALSRLNHLSRVKSLWKDCKQLQIFALENMGILMNKKQWVRGFLFNLNLRAWQLHTMKTNIRAFQICQSVSRSIIDNNNNKSILPSRPINIVDKISDSFTTNNIMVPRSTVLILPLPLDTDV